MTREPKKMLALKTLDCGSLLPLSVTQPAANRRGQQAGSRKAAAGCTQSRFSTQELTHGSFS
jgi:hypothetical protein